MDAYDYHFYANDDDLPKVNVSALGPTSLERTTPVTVEEVAEFPGEFLETEMRKLSGHIAAAMCSFLIMVGEFDARKRWAAHECHSCAHWLTWRCGISLGTARDQVRVARKLRQLPRVTEAFSKGQLSYSKARAICRVASPETEDQWIDLAGNATAKILDQMASAWAQSKERFEDFLRRITSEETQEENSRRMRSLSMLKQPNGDLVVNLRIPAGVESEIFLNAIDRCLDKEAPFHRQQSSGEDAESNEFEEEQDHLNQRRLDALLSALVQNADCDSSLAPPADITVCHHTAPSVSAETFREDSSNEIPSTDTGWLQDLQRAFGSESLSITSRGFVMTPTMMEFLSCDAGVRHMIAPWDDDEVHEQCCERDTGQSSRVKRQQLESGLDPQRHPNAAMRRKIFARDGGTCQFPSCDRRHRLAVHHIVHWANGGRTQPENLILLCPKHHHAVHDRAWDLTGTATQPVFKRPDGETVAQVPALMEGSLQQLIRTHSAQSLEIGPASASGTWYGESIDWGSFFAAFPIETPDWFRERESVS